MTESSETLEMNCEGLTPEQVGAEIRRQAELLQDGQACRLVALQPESVGIGAALETEAVFSIDGSVGDYGCMLNQGADWEIDGNAGHCVGHSTHAGRVLVRGTAGDFVGAYSLGGFVAVLGRAGNHCGYALDGGEVLIRSVVGDAAGAAMRGGVLVLANGAGEQLGKDMKGGVIFLRGQAKSVADEARLVRIKDADALRLSLLLARAGISGDAKEFRLYMPRKRES